MHVIQENAMKAIRVAALTIMLLVLIGCTAEKAKALRIGAIQFKNESHVAVRLIDETIDLEHASGARTRTGANIEFAETIIAFREDGRELTPEIIDLAREPFAVEVDATTAAAQRELVASLQRQYSAFGDAFEDLEHGFLFSAEAVKAAGPAARRLTAQLVVFANAWSEQPPRFLQRRTALLVRMEDVADAEDIAVEQKKRLLFDLNEAWDNLLNEEELAQRAVVEQCLKAAAIGYEVQGLIDRFDKVSLKDTQDFVAFALSQAGQLTGEDFSSLSQKSASFLERLREDPVWRESIEFALEQMNGQGSAGVGDGSGGGASPSNGE
jgi:hypothetical protein